METIKDLLLLISKTYFLILAIFSLFISIFFEKIGINSLSSYFYVKSIKFAKKAIE
jgi:hypothetical protein